MRSRLVPFLALACLICLPAVRAQDAKATKKTAPALVVRIRSFDSILADAGYLAALVGKEDEAKMGIELLKERTGNKGLDGLDTKKPMGGYVFAGENGTDSYGAFMLPVKDEKTLLSILENNGIKVEKGKDGLYSIKDSRIKIPIFFRFENGYAYIAPLSELGIAKNKLLKPADVLPESETALAAAVIRLDQIPDGIKEVGLGQLGLRLADIREQHAEKGTPAQRELIDKTSREANAQLKSIVNEGRELTIRLDVDQKKNDLGLSVSFDAKPDTKLASDIADLAKRRSLFAALAGKDSALSFLLSYALPERLQKALGPVVDEGIKTVLEQAQDDAHKQIAEKLLKVLAPSIKAGEIDAAMDLRGPSANKHYTLVGAIKLKNGEEVEKTLKEIITGLPEQVRDMVKFDADKAGGTPIHKVDFEHFMDDNARTIFGNGSLYVALRSNALYWSGGENGLEAMKGALSAQPGTAGVMKLNLSLAHLAPLMAKEQPGAPKAAADAFGKNQSQDKIQFTVSGGSALKAEIHIKAAVLKFFAAIAEAKHADQ
jgi:hypothetical protein